MKGIGLRLAVGVVIVVATLVAPAVTAPSFAAAPTCTPSSAPPLSTGAATVAAFSSVAQVLPAVTRVSDGVGEARWCQARGTLASFQLAVGAGATPLTLDSVAAAGDLVGPGGAVLSASNVRFHREAYVRLTTMSSAELPAIPRGPDGSCTQETYCRVADALIPAVDPLTGAARNPFGIAIPAGENRAAWIDVKVPASATPGTYTGAVRVTVSGAPVDVPVRVGVIAATVAPTGSDQSEAAGTTLRSEFRIDSSEYGQSWARWSQLARIGLANGVVFGWGNHNAPSAADFETYVRPLLEGTAANVEWPGSRIRDVVFHGYGDDGTVGGLGIYRNLLTATPGTRAWFMCDEVPVSQCASQYAANAGAWPGLPIMAIPRLGGSTDPLDAAGAAADLRADATVGPRLQGLVPLVNRLHPSAQLSPYANRRDEDRTPAFAAWRSGSVDRTTWFYNSCMSAGCGIDYTPQGYYQNWPSYAIDQLGTQQVAMGWQAYLYGIDGEHYWDINVCRAADPTGCLYETGVDWGMNGDGTLVYAPAQFGLAGTTTPIESIRLKRIRDGRTMFSLLQAAPEDVAGDVRDLAQGLFPSMSRSAPTVAQYESATAALMTALDGQPPTPVAPGAPGSVTVVPDDGYAIVRWNPPSEWGTGAFTRYLVEAEGGGASCTTGSTQQLSCRVTGLTNGATVRFRVRAESSDGTGAWSAWSAAVTPLPYVTNTSPPRITGAPRFGGDLVADPGAWGNGTTDFAFTWKRDGTAMATGSQYRVVAADVGHSLTVMVRGGGAGRLDYYVTSPAVTILPALTSVRETPATTKVRSRGIRRDAKITLRYRVDGAGTIGGTLSLRAGRRVVARATVRSSVVTLRVPRRAFTRGKRTFGVVLDGTAVSAPSSATYRIRVR